MRLKGLWREELVGKHFLTEVCQFFYDFFSNNNSSIY
jgi:hypothetical protein